MCRPPSAAWQYMAGANRANEIVEDRRSNVDGMNPEGVIMSSGAYGNRASAMSKRRMN